jgi:hypothetical protein
VTDPDGDVAPEWMSRTVEMAESLTKAARSLRAELTATERECGALKGQLARRRRGAGIQPHPGDLADELMLAARLAQQRLNPLDRYCADLVAKAARASGHAAGSGPAARASDLTADLLEEAAAIRVELDAVEREHIGLRAQVERLRRQGKLDRPRPAGRSRDTGPLPDVAGYGPDLLPDPLEARTASEFIGMLREFRIWAGEPSFRLMAMRTDKPASTLAAALNGSALPPMDTVTAIISGCNGSIEDQRRFMTAWRRIRLGRADSRPRAARHRVPARQDGPLPR